MGDKFYKVLGLSVSVGFFGFVLYFFCSGFRIDRQSILFCAAIGFILFLVTFLSLISDERRKHKAEQRRLEEEYQSRLKDR